MMMKPRDYLELLLLAAIWGAAFLFLRLCVPAMGATAATAARVLIGAVTLLPVVWMRRDLGTLLTTGWPILVMALLTCVIPFMGFGFAARHLPAGALTIFNATTPLWGGLIGWIWYREHLSLRQLAGLLLGVAGVAVLMKDRAAMPQADLVSFACALVAPLSSAMAVHFSRRRLAHVNPLTNTVGTLLASSVLLVPIAVWQGPQPLHGAIAGAAAGWTQLSTLVWASVGALGLLCTGYAYLLFYRLLRNIGPQRTLSVAFLIPVFGMTWGALWLDEPVTLGMMAAAAVIMSGTWLSTTSPKPS